MSEDDLQHPRRSAEESNFLADVFERADPGVAAFMARHNALLERVTVLERAMEGADAMLGAVEHAPESWVGQAQRVIRRALDG